MVELGNGSALPRAQGGSEYEGIALALVEIPELPPPSTELLELAEALAAIGE